MAPAWPGGRGTACKAENRRMAAAPAAPAIPRNARTARSRAEAPRPGEPTQRAGARPAPPSRVVTPHRRQESAGEVPGAGEDARAPRALLVRMSAEQVEVRRVAVDLPPWLAAGPAPPQGGRPIAVLRDSRRRFLRDLRRRSETGRESTVSAVRLAVPSAWGARAGAAEWVVDGEASTALAKPFASAAVLGAVAEGRRNLGNGARRNGAGRGLGNRRGAGAEVGGLAGGVGGVARRSHAS